MLHKKIGEGLAALKKDGIVYGLFLVITILFFMPFLSGARIFGFRDLSLYFYPLRHLMVEMVWSGQLPLWNPYIYCGIPLFATLQAGFLYPFSILFYFLPFNLGFNWFIIIHYFLAAVFTYLLMRHYGTDRLASFFSGMVFAFSGYLLSVSNMNTSLSSVIWLPLALLFWDRFLGIGKEEREKEGEGGDNKITSNPCSSLISLISVLSLMFLGGEPTIFYSTFLILLIYALFMDKTSKLLYLLALPVVVAGVLAVQVLPLFEYITNSVRTWRTEFGFISHSSFPAREALNFVFPNFFGNFLEGTYVKEILGNDLQTWILSPYIGVLPVFLAVIALFKRSRKVYFFLFTALVFLLLAFGHYTPFYKLLFYSVPWLSAIRYPVKFLFFPTFAAAVLAGWGLTELAGNLKKREITAFWGIKAALSGVLLLSVVYFWQLHQLLALDLKLSEYHRFVLYKLISWDKNALFCLLLILFAAGLAMILYYRKNISGPVFVSAIVFLVFADLYYFNYRINPPIPADLFADRPANVAALAADRDLFRFFVDPRVFERSGTFFSDQKDILFSLRSKLSSNLTITDHLYDWYGRESIEPLRNTRLYWAFKYDLIEVHPDILSYSNVKYVLAWQKLKDKDFEPVLDKDFYLYRNKNARARAYIDGGKCSIVKYEPNVVEISAESATGGRLVLADNYYPGWKAYVDGKETKIKRVYYLFRGVDILKGRHDVKFVYDPLSVKAGLVISLISILSLIALGYKYR